ncbi:Probable transcription factor At5g28040 [Linum perenne]
MAAEHDDTVFDLDDDEDSSYDDDLENDDVLAAEEEEEDEEDLNSVPSPSTPPPPAAVVPTAVVALPVAVPSASLVTVASAAPNGSDPHRIASDMAVPRPRMMIVPVELRKPAAMTTTTGANSNMITIPTPTPQPLDKSRQLFQRLWTDEDEIELLQGFYEYTSQRGGSHHDTAMFYDQIKSKLQLDFNKNQLVEKLRRLKKKYRNVLSKIGSGKEFSFKSPHDQVTFEISRKIWSSTGKLASVEDGNLDEEEGNPNLNSNSNPNLNNSGFNDGGMEIKVEDQKSTPRSRKRPRPRSLATPLALNSYGGSGGSHVSGGGGNTGGSKMDDKRFPNDVHVLNNEVNNGTTHSNVNVPGLIEETVKSCLSPLFKELLSSNTMMPGSGIGGRGIGGLAMNSMPLSFGGVEMMADEKWRKQQILELEVYSKRLELVQDQVRSQLEELRSVGR